MQLGVLDISRLFFSSHVMILAKFVDRTDLILCMDDEKHHRTLGHLQRRVDECIHRGLLSRLE